MMMNLDRKKKEKEKKGGNEFGETYLIWRAILGILDYREEETVDHSTIFDA
jgi:hypothetical protein